MENPNSNAPVQPETAATSTQPTTPAPAAPVSEEVEELKRQLEAANSRAASADEKRKSAENALDNERKAHSKLKKSSMSEEDVKKAWDKEVSEREAAIAEKEKAIQLSTNRATAKEMLAGLGIAEGDFDTIVSADEDKTLARCKVIKALHAGAVSSTTKAVEEKYMQSMSGGPPTGGGGAHDKEYENRLLRAAGLMT
jgi:chromosome segregation ATPase